MSRGGLFGRERSAERLDGALADVALGTAMLITVEGEPGIGKTALVEAARHSDPGRRFRWFVGRSGEFAKERPFGVIADAFGCSPRVDEERRRDIAELLRAGDRTGYYRVLDALDDLAEAEGLAGPLAIVIDDLQWADRASIAALAGILKRCSALPVAVVTTIRYGPTDDNVAALLRSMKERVTRIELSPLDDGSIDALVADRLGRAAGPRLRAFIENAGGNPFHIIELLGALEVSDAIVARDDVVDTDADAIPASLIPTIMATLAPLSEPATDVLRYVAVFGAEVAIDTLASVMGREPAAIRDAILTLLDHVILKEEGDRVRFAHDLIREAVYADLGSSVQASMHAEVGWTLARIGAPATEVAAHLSRGAPPGDTAAADWIIEAALGPGLDVATEAALLRRAIQLHPAHPDRTRLTLRLARLSIWDQRDEDVVKDVFRILGETSDVGERLAMMESLIGLGEGRYSDLALRGATLADGLPDDVPIWVAMLRARFHFYVGDTERALRETEECYARARSEDGATRAESANQSSWLATLLGRSALAAARAGEALRFKVSGSARAVYWRHRVWALADLDGATELETACLAGAIAADDAGNRMAAREIRGEAAHWLYATGRWDEANLELDVWDLLADGSEDDAQGPHPIRSWMALRRDEFDPADDADPMTMDPFAGATFAIDAMDRGDVAEAGAIAKVLIERLTGRPPEHRSIRRHFDLLAPLARVALAAGERDAAARARDHAVALAEGADAPGVVLAAAWTRAVVDEDPGAARRTVELARATPRIVLGADALVDAAGPIPAAEARPILEEALAIYGQVGAAGDVRRVSTRMRALIGDRSPAPPKARPVSGWESLTAAEVDVVRLAAEGLTNRQIGERLFVSHRTVATHLSHVFDKLGIRSRVELAREAAKRAD